MTGLVFVTLGIGCFVMSYLGRDRWQGHGDVIASSKSRWSVLPDGVMGFSRLPSLERDQV